ncbi:hypothetical protein, partial [Trueperella pyogenes]|uniref:hypothetical protein n=1 Tax=Trueperella pyogenes TaxID=1661 RepID=UPI001267D476
MRIRTADRAVPPVGVRLLAVRRTAEVADGIAMVVVGHVMIGVMGVVVGTVRTGVMSTVVIGAM